MVIKAPAKLPDGLWECLISVCNCAHVQEDDRTEGSANRGGNLPLLQAGSWIPATGALCSVLPFDRDSRSTPSSYQALCLWACAKDGMEAFPSNSA